MIRLAMAALVAASMLLLPACGGSGSDGASRNTNGDGTGNTSSAATSGGGAPAKEGGVAIFAEAPATKPNYIFPLTPGPSFSPANIAQFQYLMYRPLYWYGKDGTVALDEAESLAAPPEYAPDRKSVTITLKDDAAWSDGKPISSRDVEFWVNLLKANKANWGSYIPGGFPDNVESVKLLGPKQIRLNLDKAYGEDFYTYNQLSQIVPIPRHAWDRTSASGAVSDHDRTPAGAKRVYAYLDGRAKQLADYAKDPLWQVVSGPWKLKAFDTDGNASFVPNDAYAGPNKPHLDEFRLKAFTSDTAEFNVLRGDGLDYGYLPLQALPQRSRLESSGWQIEPWEYWGFNYVNINYSNPDSGALFKQHYIREAMQRLVDQKTIVEKILQGFGYETPGPVPSHPENQFAGPDLESPYPFDPEAAAALIADHGWKLNGEGQAATCERPGDGPTECGPGIEAGRKLEFELKYTSGQVALEKMMQELQSRFSSAGIKMDLKAAPYADVTGVAVPCERGKPCLWDAVIWGNGWQFLPQYYPTGHLLFTTAGSYAGYGTKEGDRLIEKSLSGDKADLLPYADYIAKDAAVLFVPTFPTQVSVIAGDLQGTTPQDPNSYLTPERWYFTATD